MNVQMEIMRLNDRCRMLEEQLTETKKDMLTILEAIDLLLYDELEE